MGKITKHIAFFIFLVAYSTCNAVSYLRIPLHASIVTLDTSKLQDISSLWISRQIDCQLVRMTNELPRFEAAKSLRYITPLELSIELKPNMKFSDGSELTARDVIATFSYLRSKGTEFRNMFDWIDSISSTGKYHIAIKLKKPIREFVTVLAAPHYAIFKEEFILKAKNNPALWNFPIGCGGYRISKSNKEYIELSPVSKGIPIRFTFVPDNQIMTNDINKFDMISMEVVGNGNSFSDFQTIKVFDPYQYYLALNTRINPWKDRKARCAFFAKLNPSIAMTAYGNEAKKADNLIPSGVLGYKNDNCYLNNIKQQFNVTPLPKKKNICVSFISTSIEQNYRHVYLQMIQKLYPTATAKVIDECSDLNRKIQMQGCDGIFYAAKSNYLDAYEYIQELSTQNGVNPTGYFNNQLALLIKNSQIIDDPLQRAKAYQSIIKQIDSLCILYPLFTMSYDKIYIRTHLSAPGLGQGPINDYYLGYISYK